MNIDPDGKHEIVRMTPQTEEDKARWLQLTDEQARELQTLSPEERKAWLRKILPTKERLARHLRWIGLTLLAARAQDGEFSDFDSDHATPKIVLLKELQRVLLKAKRKGQVEKRKRIEDLVKHVKGGEYDDTKAESDAWAAKQTGEIRDTLDRMGLS